MSSKRADDYKGILCALLIIVFSFARQADSEFARYGARRGSLSVHYILGRAGGTGPGRGSDAHSAAVTRNHARSQAQPADKETDSFIHPQSATFPLDESGADE